MAILKSYKVTALPGTPVGDALYYVKGVSDARIKAYVTNSAGTAYPLGMLDEADVLSVLLTGYTVGSNTALTGSDSILTAFRNIQGQINSLSSSVATGVKIALPLDCSTNPNYPAGVPGDAYRVTVGGRIGGASGPLVKPSDTIYCIETNAGGTEAVVGSSWYIVQGNLDDATETVAGVIKLASTAQVIALTAADAAVTPATLSGGVRATVLTGYTVGTNTTLAASDTLLAALGKLQGQITAREATITAGTTAQYWRGDKTWQTLNTTAVPEGTNQYFTTARVLATALTGYTVGTNTALAAADTILAAMGKIQAQLNAKEGTITSAATTTYFRGDKTFQTLNTTVVPEGTNLYYTAARVRAEVITGYVAGTNTALAATDTILGAFGKIQGQLNAKANSTITLTFTANNGIAGGASAVDLTANRSWTFGLTGQALAFHNLASFGMIALTAAGTVVARTLASAGATIEITNPAGIAGNPNLEMAWVEAAW